MNHLFSSELIGVEFHHGAPRGRSARLLPLTQGPNWSSQLGCFSQFKNSSLNPGLCAGARSLSHQRSLSVERCAACRSCSCILMNSCQGDITGGSGRLRWHRSVVFPHKGPRFFMDLLCCFRLSPFYLLHCRRWRLKSSGSLVCQHTSNRRTLH